VYALAVLCGCFAAGVPACVQAKRAGLDDTDMIVTLLCAGAGAFAGGHLLYAILHPFAPRLFAVENADMFFTVAAAVFGGQVFYGGIAGGIAAGALFAAASFRNRLGEALDIIAPKIPLFHAFGRLGCFAAGCCFGVESRTGFIFTRALVRQANGTPRIPVQLIEAAFNFVLFAALEAVRARRFQRIRGT
jgi:phosphatidylglycerol:prolipoprotein diacylglycerol transferase